MEDCPARRRGGARRDGMGSHVTTVWCVRRAGGPGNKARGVINVTGRREPRTQFRKCPQSDNAVLLLQRCTSDEGILPRSSHISRHEYGSLLRPAEIRVQRGELLRVRVPVHPKPALGLVYLAGLDLEGDVLVRLRRENEVLPRPVGGLHLLLVSGHEPVTRTAGIHDVQLRVLDLEEEAHLPRDRVAHLGDLVARSTDLDDVPLHRRYTRSRSRPRGQSQVPVPGVEGGAPRKVGLVLLALRVGKVAPLVRVQSQAKFAFVRPQVILEEQKRRVQQNGGGKSESAGATRSSNVLS
ncbi:MAG: hypothetical protein BJ554DRAFT_1666 [Olpidium bornovanus]|uniref:Uncharacterized protein n=1 Tax=Olpidium bornovanus TaxID=278681 RepID=A0A8H7ZS26_9FUNG|nr:MAG: hypothetical protein BJ554DRAFT_1666 [Olpidium bornovanus]